ncbi:MAG: VWA domain-containing protein [Deltaproteobacteria bacterium]|nr:VWA domain-containing protein [Deltaproteobacteria bacterium]
MPAVTALAAAATATSEARKPGGAEAVPTGPVAANVEVSDRKVQLALLLDTSNSMDGLIDQARSQLWRIVNELSRARRDGKAPLLELALFEYGNSGLSEKSGYIRLVSPFTRDLDLVSERLFALATNGGDEFVGHAIKDAVERLEWSKNSEDLKLVFVAGNESFDQGGVRAAAMIRRALKRGITVNTIYCGGPLDGDAAGWKGGALLADGRFMTIDQDQKIAEIDAPQDAEIQSLSAALNETYVGYGTEGARGLERQSAQDVNARKMKQGAAVQRSLSKSLAHYKNSSWDLVDGVAAGKVDVGAMDEDDLPTEMRGLSSAERKGYVAQKATKRNEIKARLSALGAERAAYVQKERMKSQASGSVSTLDTAMLAAVRDQAKRKGYGFDAE